MINLSWCMISSPFLKVTTYMSFDQFEVLMLALPTSMFWPIGQGLIGLTRSWIIYLAKI